MVDCRTQLSGNQVLNHLSRQYIPQLGKLLGPVCTHFDPPWKDDDDVDDDDDDDVEDVEDADNGEDVEDDLVILVSKDDLVRIPNPF